ncbi:recombination-associated protein RdgC [Oceaniserpentilla sp. 4NH20-0058]|uniref:recombination-associated protein RdgC n=1 Tax=Oceaniserpentilla sp. 4NH20-0058 TaxID=3127660 RepID=UPI00310866A9
MQVRNFYWYVLNKPLPDRVDFEKKLESKPFEPCMSQQLSSQGWVSAVSSGELVYEAHGAQLLMLKQEKRLLPASVVNEYLQVKIEEFEQAEGFSPSRKIRQQLKEDLTQALLPKAFTKSSRTPVLIFPKQGWLMVLSGSAKSADDVTAYLRDSLDGLPISLVNSDNSPSHVMTSWLSNPLSLPQDWALGEEVELQDAEGALVRARNHDLLTDELNVHLDAGKIVNKLHLIWRENVSFLLQDDLSIKRIKLLLEQEEAPGDSDSQDARFAHEFALSCNWLIPFCQSLLAAMGGLDKALAASQSRAFS